MKYISSEHYREDPRQEVEAAFLAGNSPGSLKSTFEARLQSEVLHMPPDADAIQRIQEQLAHIGALSTQVEIAA